MRKPLTVALAAIVVGVVDFILEKTLLPIFYSDLPTPFPGTSKPIGALLIPATFFHLTIAIPSLLAVLYVARKAGYKVEGLLPESRHAKIEYGFLMLLFISGMALWRFPIAFFPFILSGLYLVVAEIR